MVLADTRTRRSPTWGMCWTILGSTTWAFWGECNRKKHESISLTVSKLTRRIVVDVHIVFDRDVPK